MRIINPDPPLVVTLQIFWDENRSCFRLRQLRDVFFIVQETEVLRTRRCQRGHCGDGAISVAIILASNKINDFSKQHIRHGRECIGLPTRIKRTLANMERPLQPRGPDILFNLALTLALAPPVNRQRRARAGVSARSKAHDTSLRNTKVLNPCGLPTFNSS